MPTASLSVEAASVVEQRIDLDRRGTFRKEIVRATLDDQGALALVRKRDAAIEPRATALLIHGFAQNRYSWHLDRRSFVNDLAARGIDVWNLELRGHGRSRTFGSAPAHTFSQYVDDVVAVGEAVAAESGRPITLIGHSLGGAVAYGAAPRIERVLAGTITLGGIYHFGANGVTAAFATFLHDVVRAERWVSKLGANLQSRALGRFFARFRDQADDLFWSLPTAGWAPGSTEPEVLKERLERGFDWTGINIFLEMMRWARDGKIEGGAWEEAFAALDRPLLVLAGDRDGLLPPADAMPAYTNSRSRDKSWKLLSPAREEGHWGHLDIVLGRRAPQYVWPLVADWMLERAPRP